MPMAATKLAKLSMPSTAVMLRCAAVTIFQCCEWGVPFGRAVPGGGVWCGGRAEGESR